MNTPSPGSGGVWTLVRIAVVLFVLSVVPPVFGAPASPVGDEIRERVEQIRAGAVVAVAGQTISSALVLPAFYERRDYAPAWTNPQAVRQLIDTLQQVDSDGLVSDDYHLPTILALQAKELRQAPATAAGFDMLMTDALIRLGYHLLAGKVDDGRRVDPASVDWSQYPQKRFPYLLRQNPGPGNALGRIRFMFPNKYAVYLHDTPSRSLFERDQRAFSSGCIRVQRSFELAELLLDDPQWTKARIEEVVASKQTTRLDLSDTWGPFDQKEACCLLADDQQALTETGNRTSSGQTGNSLPIYCV